jgi:hypothetical protein
MYTKGDWKLNPLPNPLHPKYYCLYTKEGDHTTINHICQITDNGLNDKNEMHGNALLLAAAPSMYEALQLENYYYQMGEFEYNGMCYQKEISEKECLDKLFDIRQLALNKAQGK